MSSRASLSRQCSDTVYVPPEVSCISGEMVKIWLREKPSVAERPRKGTHHSTLFCENQLIFDIRWGPDLFDSDVLAPSSW